MARRTSGVRRATSPGLARMDGGVSGFPLPPPEALPANGRGGSHVFGRRSALDDEHAMRDGLMGDRRDAGVVLRAVLGKHSRRLQGLSEEPLKQRVDRVDACVGSSAALWRATRLTSSDAGAGHDCERRLVAAGTPACMDSTSGGRHARLGAKLTASGMRSSRGSEICRMRTWST